MKRMINMVVLLLVALGVPLQAQRVDQIPFKEKLGTYTDITGGTVVATGAQDDVAFAVTLPFAFTVGGTTYPAGSTCGMNSNGYLSFGGSYYMSYYPIYYSYTGTYPYTVLVPMAYDLQGTATGEMRFQVTGSAPKRVVTYQWKDWTRWPNSSYPNTKFSFQLKLYETSNMFEYVYGTFAVAESHPYMSVGVANGNGTYRPDYVQRAGQWVGSTKVMLPTAPGTSTNTMPISPTAFPPAGYTYIWGCYVPDNVVDFQLTDAAGNPVGYYYSPGTAYVNYRIDYPADQAYTVPMTVKFFRVGDQSGQPALTYNFNVNKQLGTTTGIEAIPNNLQPSYYIVEVTFRVWNNCLDYEDVVLRRSTLFIAPGTSFCEVWPGDVNNDGAVNYGDRASLNKYIFDANMRDMWLKGPGRYNAEVATNPLVLLKWLGQPGIPWYTPEGCYMDADGNGVVNNFDYIAIKLNWTKTHGGPAKNGAAAVGGYSIGQNYPNPFNPSTTLDYTLPERSQVRIVVTDMLGREVAVLADGAQDAGTHNAVFDGAQLGSGVYMARATMTGLETGSSFSRTIKMTLDK